MEVSMAEAWGDAPFLIPRVGIGSESEKSFPFQIWSHSTLGRESDGKSKKSLELDSGSRTRTRPPLHSRIKSFFPNGVQLRSSVYFSPQPPSSPLSLASQISLEPPYEDISNNECIKTNFDPTFTACRQYNSLICLVIRNMVENIVDKVVYIASEIALRKSHVDQSAAAIKPKVQVGAVSRGSSALCCRPRDIATRNIAVQAKTNTIRPGKKPKKDYLPAEWPGSVRALRDSHVRLILRQMRHINCLNRVLDRHL